MIHLLERRQVIPASLEECWAFFSNPGNLARLTPGSLAFQVRSEPPSSIYEGLMIEYRIRPFPGLRLTWLTEITHVEHLVRFVDEQRVGPYALWHHEHHFGEIAPGKIAVCDRVHYRLPFASFSEPGHRLFVRPQLESIFEHRRCAIEEIFNAR